MNHLPPTRLLLIGYGRMGSALAQIWVDCFPELNITVIDPNPVSLIGPVSPYLSLEALESDSVFDVIVLAVKPKDMDTACASLKPFLASHPLVLSIAAGKSLAYFEEHLGTGLAIVRAMPNTPAAIGHGMSVACHTLGIDQKQKHLASALLSATGKMDWLEDESLMDAVTGVSGSGPAYVFLLIEALAEAGIAAGLTADMAARLSRQTVIGAAYLAEQNADLSALDLREQVTSAGGTTEAALTILLSEESGLKPLMKKAVASATARSQALGRSS
ncbi:MAG: pyrroline-5-carboxylate reductase [Alphaproteobacteria bacterium]|jgi:pyrroline-5-carboxylate reductase|nr:pyrroline-5-carboxylate reductase [Alphaproteobacteria bacterium]MBP9867607.1 pyrroline-5-carboxylate reductase [Alphaproteobacteria bacterium]